MRTTRGTRTSIFGRPSCILKLPFTNTTKGTMKFKLFSCGSWGAYDCDVPANLDNAYAYVRAKIPNFRTYTSWGHDEAIIGGYYDAVLAENALGNRGRPLG